MTKTEDTITLAAQIEGPDADESTDKHRHELRLLLRNLCQGPYSPEVDEFALILRVDGSITQWNREGCAYLRRSFKERYITIDIFVPVSAWKNKSEKEMREYLVAGVKEALSLCIKRLQKDKTPVDGDQIMADVKKVETEYLKDF